MLYKRLTIFVALLVSVTIRCDLQSSGSTQTSSRTGESPSQSGLQQSRPSYIFTSDSTARNIPFDLNANKVYLQVSIQDNGRYWFILDSGGSFNVVDQDLANTLGISLLARPEIIGAGQKSVKAATGSGITLSLDGLKLINQTITAIPINSLISYSEGRNVDGLLCYDFFNQFVIEINYVQRYVNIYKPQSYKYTGAGEVIPISLDREHAFVSATILLPTGKAVNSRLLVDTGFRTAITLNSPFVQKHNLAATSPKIIYATTGVGIGGETIDAVGRVGKLQLGRFTMNNPVVAFSQAEKGVLASSDFSGILGGEILRRFKVIFDYSRGQMILEPNKYFSEPYEFDMSGLFVTATGNDLKTFEILRVADNSPGFESGLREGDIIEALDGRLASGLTLELIRQLFKKGEGHQYKLNIRRGNLTFEAKVKLRRLI